MDLAPLYTGYNTETLYFIKILMKFKLQITFL